MTNSFESASNRSSMSSLGHYFRITRSQSVLNTTHCESRLLGFLSCATRDSNGQEELPMSGHYWLPEYQLVRIRPYFPRSNRTAPNSCSVTLNKQRHKIENMFAKLKDWRRIATLYDRCAHIFMSAICIAATVIFWIINES